MPAPTLTSARRNHRLSVLIAQRAVREARRARSGGAAAVAAVVAAHQIANAQTSEASIGAMLAEQAIKAPPQARLNLPSFTTERAALGGMLDAVTTDLAFDRLVESLVTDAARAAESVATAARPRIGHVRLVNPPCCSRCAILAGRFYRWSDGFQRHPGCDCSMVPATDQDPPLQNPHELVEAGLVRGLSKDDMRALADGADLNQVVNVRKKAGLLEAGHALTRGGRPTPAGIYRMAGDDRDKALDLLARYGYLT